MTTPRSRARGVSMRILVLSNLFPPDTLGGYELLTADVVEELRARGHDVEVFTSGERGEVQPGIHRRVALVRPFGEPGSLDRLRHLGAARSQHREMEQFLAERAPFDAVLVMSLRRLGLHLPRFLARRGLPLVFCFNDDWLLAHRPGEGSSPWRRRFWRAMERGPMGSRSWSGVPFGRSIYVSAAIRDALVQGGAPVPEGVVAWQGVSRRVFSSRAFRRVPRSPQLLFAGRIHPTKGCDIAIECVARLHSKGIDASLTLAGTGAPGEMARLAAVAETLGVSHRVTFRGFVPRHELAEIYRAHDVFVFPSKWEEPAGLTYLEAMACGVPVVAMPTGGARELLVHEGNCLTTGDAEGMAASVERLIEDADLCRSLIEGAEVLLREQASLERYVEVIEQQLEAGARSALEVPAENERAG